MSRIPNVSIVVIGRNEEKKLDRTFQAIRAIDYPGDKLEVIYVDSDSTDRSMEIARKYADKVIIERHQLPSAARGRNRGLIEARHEIVHFVDGDVRINASYMRKAIDILSRPGIHAVTGVIRESSRKGWNRIVSACWAAPKEGPADFTATGGTYRRDALLQVDGYDERLVLGEESELGERFRLAGFTIWSTLQEMGVHDYGIHSFAAYIKFLYRDGQVKTRTMMTPGSTAYFSDNRRMAWSNILQNTAFFTLVFVICLMRRAVWLPVLLLSILVSLFMKYYFLKNKRNFNALLYFILMNICKPVVFAGQICEWVKIRLDRSLLLALKEGKMALSKKP